MATSVRIWQKRRLHLDFLTFQQRDMVQIGSAGLLSVFKRLSQAQGPTDGPAKPLKKRYAIYKSKLRRGNRRDLKLTGNMLRNLSLRTVSERTARASLTSRKERIKGLHNAQIEPWLVWSPMNIQAAMQKARQVFLRTKERILRWGYGG
jgi:hypothetical protein